MQLATLEGRRVAVWGLGREGHAACRVLQERMPGLRPTVYCSVEEAATLPQDGTFTIVADQPTADDLAAFDYVIKSPGISKYRPEVQAAESHGTVFTSGTALWFGDNPQARIIGVTGTKGKSTTSAMLAHLARSAGIRTALAGNIGMPLLDLLGQQADLWVIELSSFQTGEAGPVDVGMVTSLYEEHLDWHGSVERYMADKLVLADVSDTLVVNGTQQRVLDLTANHRQRMVYGTADAWHVGDDGQGGDAVFHGERCVLPLAGTAIHGRHNALNACGALTALECMGVNVGDPAAALRTFKPLPHRLQPLGKRDGLAWIDDSISTTPNATLAALASLPRQPVVLIVGGHDRGLDWSGFATAITGREGLQVVTQGANGPRIAAAMRDAGEQSIFIEAETLEQAVDAARRAASAGAVIVLSPGAPSFDQFHDYAARGRRFAELAGFDAGGIGAIGGLGIA